MHITVTKNNEVVYQQKTADSKTLNTVVAHVMAQPGGNAVVTTVANNGHKMEFATADFPVEPLIRKVNDIAIKSPAKKKVETVET